MTLTLYAHPFSSYSWKVLISLYENATPFTYRSVEEPGAMDELEKLWPFRQFPVLVDDGQAVNESSIILEHLDRFHPGPTRLIPDDPKLAEEARFMDRFFDLRIGNNQQKIIYDALSAPEDKHPKGVEDAKKNLDIAYAWLDERLAGRIWAVGDVFTLADCAGAPQLFYADWTYEIPKRFENLWTYRTRLLARPSIARCVDEARPYRGYFPLGAPDRD